MRLLLQLIETRPLSPAVRSLVFEVRPARKQAAEPFAYQAGQFLDLFVPVPGHLAMKRSYSIASAPRAAGPSCVELAVTRVDGGPASTALHALEVGAAIEAEGPRGSFQRWPHERDQRTLFVATGSGLAPLRAMIRAELERPESTDAPTLGLLFGVRTAADVLWGDELERLHAAHPRFSYDVTFSREPSAGRRGWVQAHLADLVGRLSPETVFVCGLSPMIEAVRAELGRLGVLPAAIRFEAFDL